MSGDKLKGKVAIVTGASSGIGLAMAEALADNGAKVGLLARRIDKLETLKQTIISKGGAAVAVKCDVAVRIQVFEAVDKVRKALGKIDILVNNAGIARSSMMYNGRVDDWMQVVDVNINGTLHCYAAALQDMMDKKDGHIVNISSLAGRNGMPTNAVYSASKYFMQGHSAAIRQELASFGIKVTVIQPSLTKTEILQKSANPDKDVEAFFADKQWENVFSQPLLESEDIAEASIFALTRKSRVGVNEIMVEPKTLIFNCS